MNSQNLISLYKLVQAQQEVDQALEEISNLKVEQAKRKLWGNPLTGIILYAC